MGELHDMLAAAFEAGCWAVQEHYRPLREGEDPEFQEMASDYASSAITVEAEARS